MRSVVNSFSSPTIILMFVGGTVALAIGGVLLAAKLFPNLADGPYEETVDGLRVVYELVFALILAFVIASVLDNYSTAEATVAAEAADLAHIKRANDALPFEQQVRLNIGLRQYLRSIVESEWDTMREGKESESASSALETVYALYQTYSPPPAGPVEEEFYDEAVNELKEIGAARRERINLSAAELPALLRIVLPLGVLLLLALEYRARLSLRSRLVHMGMLAAVVSFCYLLTVVMDYPFSGDVSVGTDVYKTGTLATFWASDTPHVLGKGETVRDLSPGQLTGVWNSDAFGTIVIREVGDELRAAYRIGGGSVVGQISPDGVFRGWWCQTPTAEGAGSAGDVEWKRVTSSDGEVIRGSWRFGTDQPFQGDWDLVKVGGPEPSDLASRLDDSSNFCRHP